MVASDRIAQLMLGLAFLWLVYQFALRQVRCAYCGGINRHEPHCPYSILSNKE